MTALRCMARLIANCRGAAAIEMALVMPILTVIMAGSAEIGRYFYQEHVLLKSVRNGTVFAARAPIDKFNCTSLAIDSAVINNTRSLVRTGELSGQNDLLKAWAATSGVSFTMTLTCPTAVGSTTLGGIYNANGGKVPVITVTAILPYQTVLSSAGFRTGNWSLRASEQAAVQGI